MQSSSCLRSLVPAALLGALLTPSTAFAHIDLLEPEARAHGSAAGVDPDVDMNTNQKSGPCGQVTNGRSTDRVTTYAPGETITIRVREETPHESYLRVSIDLDGDDDFPIRPTTTAETQEQAQAAEDALNTENTLLEVVRESNNNANFVHEIRVTLPDETCDDCTLQVIQFMFGTPNPYYYQCADIVIAEGANGAGGAGMGTAGSGSSGESGASGSTGMPSGGSGGASAGSGGDAADDAGDDDDGGCSVGALGGSSTTAAVIGLFGLALGALSRRRRRV